MRHPHIFTIPFPIFRQNIISLGIKNIYIGPSLPAFLSPDVLKVLIEKFNLKATTTPEADVRTWDNLPLYLSFGALELVPGRYEATVEFLDEFNRVLLNFTKKITFDVPNIVGDQVVYVSDQSNIPQSL